MHTLSVAVTQTSYLPQSQLIALLSFLRHLKQYLSVSQPWQEDNKR